MNGQHDFIVLGSLLRRKRERLKYQRGPVRVRRKSSVLLVRELYFGMVQGSADLRGLVLDPLDPIVLPGRKQGHFEEVEWLGTHGNPSHQRGEGKERNCFKSV